MFNKNNKEKPRLGIAKAGIPYRSRRGNHSAANPTNNTAPRVQGLEIKMTTYIINTEMTDESEHDYNLQGDESFEYNASLFDSLNAVLSCALENMGFESLDELIAELGEGPTAKVVGTDIYVTIIAA
jgi:hypothetical protein